ncbi:hypothetical protein [Parafrankia sp. CH37]|uniref:hypothetical protein n=1 Tax=Parafrankia sp. CH37 TaxID=683308 RepID=UPI0018694C7D|nr:hypothetical protein [Parafrankia sp. CH37]MBE3206429.1 hypothetical protein [Parafrankia sp. CH37]
MQALSELAPHLPPDQRGPVLTQALTTATTIDQPYARARALSRIARHLPPDLLPQALTTIATIDDPHYRAEALSELAPHLPPTCSPRHSPPSPRSTIRTTGQRR